MTQNRYISVAGKTGAKPSSGAYYDYSVGDHVLMPDSCTVVEMDKSPTDTGLLDIHGHRLYRFQESVKIGFHKS